MGKESKKTIAHIFSAAEKIVSKQGAVALTLDAVAKEADISKGGLLYHFPNKEALLKGLIAKYVEQHQKDINKYIDPNKTAGSMLRALLKIAQNSPIAKEKALLGVVANNPELLDPLRNSHHELQKLIENDGIDPIEANIINLALHGLWLMELFDINCASPTMQKKVLKRLYEWTEK